MEVFKALRIADLGINPATGETWTIGESADDWLLDFAAAFFGAYDAETGEQLIREGMLLVSKKNTKSTIAAGIMLTELICGWRPSDENLILAPTIEVAGNSFKPACDMIRADEELVDLLHIQEHIRLITNRDTKATLKVVAADAATVSGKKASRVLVDELWLFGKRPNADAMFREATGGQVSRPEGYTLYLTTQSDEPPAGVFKEKLTYARDVRDGKVENREFLPVLYEFPEEKVSDARGVLTDAYKRESDALQLTIDTMGGLGESLRKYRAELGAGTDAVGDAYLVALGQFNVTDAKAARGDAGALAELEAAGNTLLAARRGPRPRRTATNASARAHRPRTASSTPISRAVRTSPVLRSARCGRSSATSRSR